MPRGRVLTSSLKVLVAGLGVVSGCSQDNVIDAGPTQNRVASVAEPIATAVEVLRIKTDEDHGVFVLDRVRRVRFWGNGLIVVDRNEVLWFDSTGAYVGELGRKGDGPGEFRNPLNAGVLRGDSLAVFDATKHSVSIFSPEGAFVRAWRSTQPFQQPPGAQILDRDRIAGFALLPIDILASAPEGALPVSTQVIAVHADQSRHEVDSLIYMTLNAPFSPRAAVAAGHGIICYTDGAEYRVSCWIESDQVVREISAKFAPNEIDRTWAEDSLNRADAGSPNRPAEEGGNSTRRKIQLPERFPAIRGLYLDADGRLWVEQWGNPAKELPRQLDIYDPASSSLLGSVEVPVGWSFMDAKGNRMVGAIPNPDTDVQEVSVLEFRMGGRE